MRRLLALSFLLLISRADTFCQTYLVIPFHNVSGPANLDWIGESIAETIRETLVSYRLPAIDREEREEAAHSLSILPTALLTEASVIELGEKLAADRVVFGQFTFTAGEDSHSPSEGQLQIRANCIELDHTARGPEWKEAGAMADLSRLQTRLAWKTLQYAEPDTAPSEDECLESRPPVRIDAMENYIRGLLAPVLEQKHRFFTQAAHLDPEFSPPCFQLGRLQWEENSYRVAAQWLERVAKNDAHHMEAAFLLGLCRYHTGDYSGALDAFTLVARSAPFDGVYNNLAIAQFRLGATDAVQNLRQALRGDSSDPDYHFNLGYVFWRQGDLRAAQEQFRAVLKLDPEDADARQLLDRCVHNSGPRRGDLSSEGLERLTENFDEIARRRRKVRMEEGRP